MHHWLDRASKGEGGAWGVVEDSNSDSSLNQDSDTSLKKVIWMDLLCLLHLPY